VKVGLPYDDRARAHAPVNRFAAAAREKPKVMRVQRLAEGAETTFVLVFEKGDDPVA